MSALIIFSFQFSLLFFHIGRQAAQRHMCFTQYRTVWKIWEVHFFYAAYNPGEWFSPPHRSMLLFSNFVKFYRWKIGEIVRYLLDKKNFSCHSNFRCCADCAQNPSRPTPNNVLRVRQIHPNWFTFGRVTAEHVNTAKLPRRVNPIFGGSLAFSRIRMKQRIDDNV